MGVPLKPQFLIRGCNLNKTSHGDLLIPYQFQSIIYLFREGGLFVLNVSLIFRLLCHKFWLPLVCSSGSLYIGCHDQWSLHNGSVRPQQYFYVPAVALKRPKSPEKPKLFLYGISMFISRTNQYFCAIKSKHIQNGDKLCKIKQKKIFTLEL